jgi:hypothetical protein
MIQGLQVFAGQTLTWRSDYSGTRQGFSICSSTSPSPTSVPTAAPTLPDCDALDANAYFQVTLSQPLMGCAGGGGPQSRFSNRSTCYTTSNGTCFSDGPGTYGQYEVCHVRVLQSVWLYVPPDAELEIVSPAGFQVDYGSRLSTYNQLNSLQVRAGEYIRWESGSSSGHGGYTLCGSTTSPPSAAPTASPTLPSCPDMAPNATLRVSAASPVVVGCAGGGGPHNFSTGTCFVYETTLFGTCITNGAGAHAETCTIDVVESGWLSVSLWRTQQNPGPGGRTTASVSILRSSGGRGTTVFGLNMPEAIDGRYVHAGQTLTWESDYGIEQEFVLCASIIKPPCSEVRCATPPPPSLSCL